MAKGQKKQKQETINKDTFEELCKILCTEKEILGILNITDKTLNSWCNNTYGCNFSEIYKKLSEFGKASLRRAQFRIAQTNASMAIWLGKQYLNQKEFANDNLSELEDDPLTKSIKESIEHVK